ncbi:MAG: hypothetical protein ACETWT_07110 [Thermodesulfobacteriota bacterium]
MIWFLYGIAFFWIAAGTLFILYTGESRRFLRSSMAKVNPKFLAFIPMVVGILLILAARVSGAFWLILILGLLAIGKGAYFLLGPRGQIEALFDWWFKSAQDRTYRFGGILILLLGMILLSWI